MFRLIVLAAVLVDNGIVQAANPNKKSSRSRISFRHAIGWAAGTDYGPPKGSCNHTGGATTGCSCFWKDTEPVVQLSAGKITGAVCAPKRSYFSCPGTKTDMTRPAFVKGHCFASCKWTSMWCPSTSKCVVYGGEKVCFYPQ
ncbi:hypothetical protein FOZ62_030425 [Perkinsus olseni]|uniref:Secreted protein n=1 Tax=Perkinsus olseni TaxID=32597 RepID=A0A7J6TVH0_PEROL|nr:hypothetical protein FOZ62_030425 [Perkinsus olseni]